MIFSAFERMVAWRYLRSKRKEGFVSVITGFSLLGICLGVATLIIVMSVMNGFRQELLSRILGLNGHLGIYAVGSEFLEDYDFMAERIRIIPEVEAVYPVIEGQVMITSTGNAQGAIVRGMKEADLKARDIIADNIHSGTLDGFRGNHIIMGYRLAEKMGVRIGDEVTLISPQGTITAFGTIPRMKSFVVDATFNVGMFEYDSNFVFMPLDTASLYFATGKGVSNLEIYTTSPNLVDSVRDSVVPIVGRQAVIHDWQQANSAFFNAIKVERNVMFLILTLIILVAAFNIISGLIMLVQDKGKDIAVLRTIGASKSMIMRIFFISGSFIGIVGTLSGIALGLLFCDNIENIRQFLQHITGSDLFSAEIYFLSTLPAVVDPIEVFSVAVMSFVLSFLATLYPSWRASELDPVEALRYE
ncbi:MAG: lipoprotein-releasing ABC transporter permease subunit [Alphaproteobacteria bacterium]